MNIFYVKEHEYFSLVDLFDLVLYEKNNSQHDGATLYSQSLYFISLNILLQEKMII